MAEREQGHQWLQQGLHGTRAQDAQNQPTLPAHTTCLPLSTPSSALHPLPLPPAYPRALQANDGNGDQQQRSGMENAAQITAASTRAARLAQVTKWMRLWRIVKLWAFYYKHK